MHDNTPPRAAGSLDRRRLMAAAASGGVLTALSPLLNAIAQGQPAGRALLADVHCHIFNIHDLPAAEFLVNCALREKVLEAPDKDLASLWRDEILQLFTYYVIPNPGGSAMPPSNRGFQLVLTCIKEAFAREAPTVREEMDALRRGAVPAKDLKPDEDKLRDIILRLADLKDDEQRIWIGSAKGLLSASVLQSMVKALSRERHDEKPINAKLREALARAFAKPKLASGEKLAAQQADARAAAAELAHLIYHPEPLDATDTKVVPYVRAAMHITHSRQRILQDADGLFGAATSPSASPRGRDRLFCPALVDYELWLRGVRPGTIYEHESYLTPQPEQIDFMAALSQAQPRDRWVHGFAAYDPLRQAVFKYGNLDLQIEAAPEPLGLIRDAVARKGFIGAKLYPPMGFLPMGNAELHRPGSIAWTVDGPFGPLLPLDPRHGDRFMNDNFRRANGKTLGAMLDESLHALYSYCVDPNNDVAIMTHCSRTQGAFGLHYQLLDENNPPDLRRFPQDPPDNGDMQDNQAAARRSHPRHWVKLLHDFPQYSRLRLNLGHAGGIWCLGSEFDSSGFPSFRDRGEMGLVCDYNDDRLLGPEMKGGTWIEYLVRFLDKYADAYPNLYADISDWTDATAPETERRARLAMDGFARMLGKCKNPDKVLRRIMYGTDWIVMGAIGKYEGYYPAFRREIEGMLSAHFAAEFGRRAADDIFGFNAVRFLGLAPGGKARARIEGFYGLSGMARNWSIFNVPA